MPAASQGGRRGRRQGRRRRVPRAVVSALVQNGIPVLGHIGLTPQSVREMGGYRVQGKQPEQALRLIEDARELEKAGVFGFVLECVPADLGKEITDIRRRPDHRNRRGQGLRRPGSRRTRLLGLNPGHVPKFVKRYADLGTEMRKAFEAYKRDVESGSFPGPENVY